MKKIILDFQGRETKEQVQEYLRQSFGFPDYYGRNLDGLYDMLTELGEDTCVGVFGIKGSGEGRDRLAEYLGRVAAVLQDAEEENPHLCVIFGRQYQ